MLNHPHDCPVCDEGGECHLQDMTVMTGHDYRRYRFEKRTFRNQYLGPLVNHEMNRCIQCYRCVRFIASTPAAATSTRFRCATWSTSAAHEDGMLESEFSGNLVEVCPTGVFTDKTLKRHYTRKWDLQFGAVDLRALRAGLQHQSAAERYGTLRRIVNRYNGEVNGYFLCDRGRFGYEFVNSPHRIRAPRLAGEPATAEAARETLHSLGRTGAIGIGSPRASLEANFALRQLVGESRFYAGMDDAEYALTRAMIAILRAGPARTPSVREIEQCDAVFVLGEDINATAPRLALAVRQSVRQASFALANKLHVPLWMDQGVREAAQETRSPVFIATPAPTRLDDIAGRTFRGAPEEIARLGFAVAHALDPAAPQVPGLDSEAAYLAGFISEALRAAERPVVIAGAGLRSEAVVRAAAAVSRALAAAGKPALLSYTAPECNTFGLAMMDAQPLSAAMAAGAPSIIVLENDLYRRAPAATVDALLSSAAHVVALDSLENATTARAELVIPAGTFAESDGTFISNEGRAQRFFQVYVPVAPVFESWRWLGEPAWQNLDDAIAAMAAAMPQFAHVPEAAPPADLRVAGGKFPREPHRYSGRTAMLANITVHEPKPPEDPDSALKFSMEGVAVQPPPALVPFFWAPGWNSIQALNRFQEEVAGVLKGGTPGVRLVEPSGTGAAANGVPAPFSVRAGEWRVVPLYNIFGSDELSHEAPALASLIPPPYVALHPDDAAALGVAEGSAVAICGRQAAVKLMPELPRGVAGVSAGIPPFVAPPPEWSAIGKLT